MKVTVENTHTSNVLRAGHVFPRRETVTYEIREDLFPEISACIYLSVLETGEADTAEESEEAAATISTETAGEIEDYADLTVPELREELDAREIEHTADDLKADLIARLEADDEAA